MPCACPRAARPARSLGCNPTPAQAARTPPRPASPRLPRDSGDSAITTAIASPTNTTSSLASGNGVMFGGRASRRNSSGSRSCVSSGRKSSKVKNRMHAGRRSRRRQIDRLDPGVGERAAHKRRFKRARQLNIVDEPSRALDQRIVLDPGDRLPDELVDVMRDLSRSSRTRRSRTRWQPAISSASRA